MYLALAAAGGRFCRKSKASKSWLGSTTARKKSWRRSLVLLAEEPKSLWTFLLFVMGSLGAEEIDLVDWTTSSLCCFRLFTVPGVE
jgi:hypothetical protein